jgi:hypothetical protein
MYSLYRRIYVNFSPTYAHGYDKRKLYIFLYNSQNRPSTGHSLRISISPYWNSTGSPPSRNKEPLSMPESAPISEPKPSSPALPSWTRNGGNHCSTCASWSKDRDYDYVGLCTSAISLDSGEKTDSRYRCQSFQRKEGT